MKHLWRLRRPLPGVDEALRQRLADPDIAVAEAVESLVEYFWATHQHALARHGTLADYPGWPSMYGARSDAVEGVARLAPLWAACVARGLGPVDRRDAMQAHLSRMFINGCDPAHPGFWGAIGDRSTLLCEAHDLALALWISREQVLLRMRPDEQRRVTDWLAQAIGRRTADNNWHLFVTLIDAVLEDLRPGHCFTSQDRWQRVWSFERPNGCFVDGPNGHVDFYNAWGFHYPLGWLSRIRPVLDTGRADHALLQFCEWYQWLFTETGLPLFGRSLCYRHAVSAPLIRCAADGLGGVAPPLAAAAFMATWRWFTAQGGLRAGRPTQGVFADDIRWLDIYSGPASSLWGVRSLVEWVYGFGQVGQMVAAQTLPAHRAIFDREVAGLGARVRAGNGLSEVCFPGAQAPVPPPRRPGWHDRLRQWRHATAVRPDNNRLKGGLKRFGNSLEAYR